MRSTILRYAAGLAALAAVAGGAQAQTIDQLRQSYRPEVQPASHTACMCVANGSLTREGEVACIRTPQGRRMALCNKVINLLNWQVSETACPES